VKEQKWEDAAEAINKGERLLRSMKEKRMGWGWKLYCNLSKSLGFASIHFLFILHFEFQNCIFWKQSQSNHHITDKSWTVQSVLMPLFAKKRFSYKPAALCRSVFMCACLLSRIPPPSSTLHYTLTCLDSVLCLFLRQFMRTSPLPTNGESGRTPSS